MSGPRPRKKTIWRRCFCSQRDEMAEFDEERFAADINHPTDAQVERAARLLALAGPVGERGDWRDQLADARRALILHLNKAKWQIGLGS